jgi:hypothetical protein
MSHKHKLLRLVATLLAATSIACGLSLGGNDRRASISVVVFEDNDADGTQDPGEAGLVDVLVVATTNQHGAFTRTAVRTDVNGEASIEGTTTHVFRVASVPPCGYRATTPVDVSAESAEEVAFGFAPEAPQPGSASVTFHLWHDQDEDGTQDPGEPALEGVTLHTNPWGMEMERMPTSPDEDDLGVITDAAGHAMLELGASCGTLWIPEPENWRTTTTLPTMRREPGGEGLPDWLGFPYAPGTTEIDWGLTK